MNKGSMSHNYHHNQDHRHQHQNRLHQREANRPLDTVMDIYNNVPRKAIFQGAMGGHHVAASARKAALGGGLEFTGLTYTVTKKQKVEDKWTTEEVDLLHDISGLAPKCSITAVMGPSGAGKSTFLDGLAGRIASGSLDGTVAMDGHEMSPSLIKRSSAYVMQDDRLFPMLTVCETLLYAADFRLGESVSRAEKEASVEKLIEQLGLTSARNTYIGNEQVRGVSGGERRRVSIGVDIIHGPALLFLDEPTSGLDSSSAHSVIEKVHDVAQAGSVVILTIHQPSHRILQLLDNLIILARGQLIYQGSPKDVGVHLNGMGRKVPKGDNSIEYLLDVIQEYDRSAFTVSVLADYYKTKARPPSVTNDIDISVIAASSATTPAKMMLRSPSTRPLRNEDDPSYSESMASRLNNFDHSVRTPRAKGRGRSGAGLLETVHFTPSRQTPRRNSDLYGRSLNSPSYVNSVDMLSKDSTPRSSEYTVRESDYYYQSRVPVGEPRRRTRQPPASAYLGPKFHNSFWTEVVVLMKRNFVNICRTPELFLSRQVVLTVMGIMLATMFLKPKKDLKGMTHVLSFFISTVCLFFFSSNDAVPAFIQERFIFIRETSHNAYRASSYVISGLITYLPFLFVQALTYSLIVWWTLKLDGDLYYFVLILYISLVATNSFVCFVSAVVPNYILGYAAVIAFTAIFFLFCGFFVPRENIPPYWKWMHYISTIKYSYEGMMMNQFSNLPCSAYENVPPLGNTCVLNGTTTLENLSISSDKMARWLTLGSLVGWAVIYRIFFYVILRFASKNQRT